MREDTNPFDGLPVDRHRPESAEIRRAETALLQRLVGDEADPSPPRLIGRYTVQERIGAGGMGVVYAAVDAQLGRQVAIKVVKPQRGGAAARSRILREARALASLSHPNIVEIYDVGRHDDEIYLAMELVVGQTLGSWVAARKRTWREVLSVFRQAAVGLAGAHAVGLVHRDFKPGNVLVGDDGRVRVVDFGLARRERPRNTAVSPEALIQSVTSGSRRDTLTYDDAVVGTPAYMAPEQLLSMEVGPAADQFSFCVALYEALYGERPFASTTMRGLLGKMLSSEQLERPRASDVPGWLHDAIVRGLAVVPAQRFASMTALLGALRRDSIVTRWRLGMIGLAVVGIGGGLLVHSTTDAPEPCDHAASGLQAAWNEGRRAAVTANLRESGLSYADDAATRVTERLDAYASGWAGAARAACEGRLSAQPQTADATARCLDSGRRRFAALVELLGSGDAGAPLVSNASTAVRSFEPPERCIDPAYVHAAVRPPPDDATRRRVEAVDDRVAAADALLAAGRPAEAYALSQVAVTEATEIGYAPLLAAALLVHALAIRHEHGQEAQRDTLRDAYYLAAGAGDDAAAFDAALFHGESQSQSEPTEAKWWLETARAVLARAPSVEREGQLMRAECSLLLGSRQYERAIETCSGAVAKMEEAYGTDDPRLAHPLGTLGNVLREHGELERAVEVFERAVELRRTALGPEHPGVARSLGNLGNAYEDLGRFDEALETMERALAIQESALDPEHIDVGKSLLNIGRIHFKRSEIARAVPLFERAAIIVEKRNGPNHPNLATVLTAVAAGHNALRRYDEALPVLLRVLAIMEAAHGRDHPEVGRALSNIAALYSEQGEHEAALEYVQRSLAVYERTAGERSVVLAEAVLSAGKVFARLGRNDDAFASLTRAVGIHEGALGDQHPDLARALAELGVFLADVDRCAEAIPTLERAIAIFDATGPAHQQLGASRFAMARCLWPRASARPRARAFAQAAVTSLEAMGPAGSVPLADVRAWLTAHR